MEKDIGLTGWGIARPHRKAKRPPDQGATSTRQEGKYGNPMEDGSMKLATSILIVLFPMAAVGQTTLSNPQHPLTREPEPSDRQSCDLLYPPAEKSAGTEGVTVLSVRIATNAT